MTEINKLNQVKNANPSDLIPVYSNTLGVTANMAVSQLSNYILGLIGGSNGIVQQYASPNATGFSITVEDKPNVWLILTPLAGYANGTIVLPSNPSNLQQIVVSTTQLVLSFTVNGNGKIVNGAPISLAANETFTLQYDSVIQSWYSYGQSSNTLWGSISGLLSNQPDLIAALNLKANISALGSAAYTNSSEYATATQGSLADSALQPSDIGTDVQAFNANTAYTNAINVWTLPQRSAQQTLNDVSGTLTLDFNTTPAGLYVQDVSTLTVALANVPTDRAANMVLRIQHSGSASHAWAWSSSIRWVSSTPTVPTAAGSGLFIFQVFPGGFVTGAYREVAA